MRKGAIKAIDVAFVFDQGAARQIIERLGVIGGQPVIHTFEKCQKFAQTDRNIVAAQLFEKRQKH